MNLISKYWTSCDNTKSGINPTVFLFTLSFDHFKIIIIVGGINPTLVLFKKVNTLILFHNNGINDKKTKSRINPTLSYLHQLF